MMGAGSNRGGGGSQVKQGGGGGGAHWKQGGASMYCTCGGAKNCMGGLWITSVTAGSRVTDEEKGAVVTGIGSYGSEGKDGAEKSALLENAGSTELDG